VAAPLNRDFEIIVAGKIYGIYDITCSHTSGDNCRSLIEHTIPYFASLLITMVSGWK
jgi:hypothetical protein